MLFFCFKYPNGLCWFLLKVSIITKEGISSSFATLWKTIGLCELFFVTTKGAYSSGPHSTSPTVLTLCGLLKKLVWTLCLMHRCVCVFDGTYYKITTTNYISKTSLHTIFRMYPSGPWLLKILMFALRAHSMWLIKKMFLTSKFSYLITFFFSNPTHKTKTGITNRWETSNSNPPGLEQSNYLAGVIRLLLLCLCAKIVKTIFLRKQTNQHVLTFLHSILVCRAHTEHFESCFKTWLCVATAPLATVSVRVRDDILNCCFASLQCCSSSQLIHFLLAISNELWNFGF
jgi:hypothetical protein